jgi:exopolysaccharide biosynthesis polyprenyl glycosylphosphotransferase
VSRVGERVTYGLAAARRDAHAVGRRARPRWLQHDDLSRRELGRPRVAPGTGRSETQRHHAVAARRSSVDLALMTLDILPFAALSVLYARGHGVGGIDAGAVGAFAVAAVAANATAGRYGRRVVASRPRRTAIRSLLAGYGAATVGVFAAALASRRPLDGLTAVLIWGLLPCWLSFATVLREQYAGASERVLIVGGGSIARRVTTYLASVSDSFELVGYVNEGARAATETPARDHAILGSLADLPAVVAAQRVDRVIVAFPGTNDQATVRAVRACDALGVTVDVVPRMFELFGPRARLATLGPYPVVRVERPIDHRRYARLTRVLELVAAAVLLLALAPVLVAIAMLVCVRDGRPVLFVQDRVGRYGRSFRIVKFRTMRTQPAQDDAVVGALIAGDTTAGDAVASIKAAGTARVTSVGAFLRRTSLDELPQLWNVLRGEMSLVGPRPLRRFELDTLEPWQQRRLLVRPGITGLWQVSGRSDVGWDERLEMDYSYVRHHSASADLRIIARTVVAVTSRRGAV